MKKIIFLFSLACLLYSCNNSSSNEPAIVTIQSTKGGTFQINANDSIYSIEIENGKYTDTVKNIHQYYHIITEQYELNLFLEGGENLNVHLDDKKGLEGVNFTGKGADIQTYLLDKQLKLIAEGKNIDKWYNEKADIFKQKVTKLIEDLKNLLNTANLSNNFTKIESKSIDFFKFNILSSYPSYHEFLTGEKAQSIEKFIPEEINNFDFNNEVDYRMYREYKDIALNHYMSVFYKNIDKTYPTVGKEALSFVNDIKIAQLKSEIIEQCAYFMSSSNTKLQEFYDYLIANSNNDEFKRSITKRFDILKNLTKGKKSPSFAYSQPNGNILKLEDLRGKYVYIDVWATWCNPCIKELPALKTLQEKMKNKNIAFVSISVDSQQDKETWSKFINENQLGGYQLFADNSFNSFFIKQYGIDAIPRFIFIDKEGNIINADAPKPSSDKINDFLTQNIQ
jgi:thiol-disulfide isomerase/thioredoxin